ncbi:unnamed protein product [Schistosoma turkestanicum]|nr:unnamed protein product [Schistosoma turkestanicum]
MNHSLTVFKQLKRLPGLRYLAIGLFDNEKLVVTHKSAGVDVDLVNYNTPGVYFAAYNQDGFVLNTGTKVVGPCVAFPQFALSWNVKDALDISEESLSLLFMLEPPLEVLIIGKGETKSPVDYRKILKICWEHRLPVEVMPTHHAIGTFNFLNSEGRYVAAAVIPPRRLDIYDEADQKARHLLLERENQESIDETQLLNSNNSTKLLLKSNDFKGEITVSRSPLIGSGKLESSSSTSLPSGSKEET